MDSSHEKNFLAHYQQLLFGEKNGDEFLSCSVRRKKAAQMFKACLSLTNNTATCSLYESNLYSYSKAVDDKSGVNNYADSIQTLLSCSQTECKQWKSSLSLNSHHDSSHLCKSNEVNENDIQFLTQAWKSEQNEGKEKANVFNENTNSKNENSQFVSKIKRPILESMKDIKEPPPPKAFNFGRTEKVQINSFTSKSHTFNPSRSISEMNSLSTMKQFSGNGFKTAPNTMNSSSSPSLNSGPSFNFHSRNYSGPPNNMNVSNPRCSNEIKTNYNQNIQTSFCTARTELMVQNQKKWGSRNGSNTNECSMQRKYLGTTRRTVMNKFVPPIKNSSERESSGMMSYNDSPKEANEIEDERLKNIDPKMIEAIQNEIMDHGAPVHWDDIAGLHFAKTTIQEIVVWPMLKPEIFTGLRRPPKGILLFGPPGTGKTLIGKCIASQSRSTFFSISASSLTSKWIGDGEKMVRALFAVARCHQPAVVFIDEIDSLLSQRSDTEHESSRRIKTEFLVQLDGATTGEEDRILVVGATNRPQELDEAARRRLVKRLYIPLPDHEARSQIVQRLMSKERSSLTPEQIKEVASLTEGYSGADVRTLCEEASMGPIRSMSFMDIQNISADDVRPIAFEDFQCALKRVRASVSDSDLDIYLKWDKTYGSG